MSISERRLQGRFLCADLVTVTWSDPADDSASQTIHAVLEDISALGGCVQIEQSIPLGYPISLSIGESRFPGRVCYSVYRDYGYFIGIRFSEDTAWSAEMVTPDHLTNLAELGLRTGYSMHE